MNYELWTDEDIVRKTQNKLKELDLLLSEAKKRGLMQEYEFKVIKHKMKKQGLKSTKADVATAKLSITEATQLFKMYYDQHKDLAKKIASLKLDFLDYAKCNPEGWDGKVYELGDGIRIESRVSVKPQWDNDKLTLEWLDAAISAGLGDACDVSLNVKELPDKFNAKQNKLMKQIGFTTSENETLAICVG